MCELTRKQIIEKALKLQALAERGCCGEKENAKAMLHKYKQKHNITDGELENHKPFDIKGLSEKHIEEFFESVRNDLGKILIVGFFAFASLVYMAYDNDKK